MVFSSAVYDILDPDTASYHEEADQDFEDLERSYDSDHPGNVQCCVTADEIGRGDHDRPGIDRIEDHGDKCITTGAQYEVRGVGIGNQWHRDTGDDDKPGRHVPDHIAGVIKKREERGNGL